MSVVSDQAWSPVGARIRKIEAIAVTASSVVVDLSLRTNIYQDLLDGQLCLADADGNDIYYAFSSEAAADTIDNTNTTAANATQCARIPAGALVEFRPPYISQKEVNSSAGALTNLAMCKYLLVKCAAGLTATLRLSIVSEAPNKKG